MSNADTVQAWFDTAVVQGLPSLDQEHPFTFFARQLPDLITALDATNAAAVEPPSNP